MASDEPEDGSYSRLKIVDGKVVTLSASTITQYWMCKRKVYYEYLLGLSAPPNGAAIRGTGVDGAIQKGFLDKAHGRRVSVSDMIDYGIATIDREVARYEGKGLKVKWKAEEGEASGKDGAYSDLMRGVGMLWEHPEGVGVLTPHPDAPVQDAFEIELTSGVSLIGTVDLVSQQNGKGYRIHDVKTAGRSWPRGKEDMGLQPLVYWTGLSAVRGAEPECFDYRVLAFNKVTPKVECRVTNMTKARLKSLPMIVEQTAREIGGLKKGELPAPSGYLSQSGACAYCGHAPLCRESGLPV